MSLFDSIINETSEKFGLGNKAGSLLSALLALITDKNRGGFTGFLDSFNNVGLDGLVSTWVGAGASAPPSGEQLESALGEDTINEIAAQSEVDRPTATSALAFMVPKVVDTLTPNGVVPDESDLLSSIGNYISGFGGATLGGIGAAGAAASGAFDRIGTAANQTAETSPIGDGISGIAAPNQPAAFGQVNQTVDGNSEKSPLMWLLPLILLALAVILGYTFCGKSTVTTPPPANISANTNTNKAATAVNTSATGATADTARKLTEVSLPDGRKLSAYPGGIEDQLIRFIQSDEYKTGTADTLKDKWFSFDDLNFKFGTTELVPESKRQLDNIVAILKAFPDVKIKIGGYTDKKGDDAANKKLSDERAKAVKSALEKSGVGAQVPEAEGYGEDFAKIPETGSDKEREADRKTSVRLIK